LTKENDPDDVVDSPKAEIKEEIQDIRVTYHNIVDVGVCHIKFAGGELRVMSEINPLISELTTHFVDSIDT
jgi:hypothetical protein